MLYVEQSAVGQSHVGQNPVGYTYDEGSTYEVPSDKVLEDKKQSTRFDRFQSFACLLCESPFSLDSTWKLVWDQEVSLVITLITSVAKVCKDS
jgi:hypothetical protein